MRVHPCQDKVLFPELSLKLLCIQIHQARLPRIPAKCRRPEHNLPAFSQAACLSDAPGSCLPSASSSCLSAASSTSFLVDIRVQLPERLNTPVSPFPREIQIRPADANRLHLPMRPVHRGRKWFHRRFRADGDQAQVPVHISMIPLRNIVLRIIPELLIAAAGMPQLDNHRIPLLPAGSNRQEIVADNDHGSSGIQLHEPRRVFHDLRLRCPAKIQIHLYDMVSRLNTALFQSPVQQLHRLRPAVMVGIREDNQIPLYPAAAVKVIHRRQIYILRKHLG